MRSRAIVALANVNERYVPDPASDVLTGLGTLLYLVSVFLGFDVLRRISRIRGLRAAIAVQQDRQNRCCSSLSWLRSWPAATRALPVMSVLAPPRTSKGNSTLRRLQESHLPFTVINATSRRQAKLAVP
jgi:hypothetical protein